MKNKCGHFPWRYDEACNFTVYSTHQHHNARKAELPNHTILKFLFENGSKIVASACWSPLQPGSVGHQKATGQPWQSESALPRCDKSPLLSVVVGHSHEPTTHDHWTSLLQDVQPVISPILVLALKHTIARLECYNSYSYITWRIRLSIERYASKRCFKRCLPWKIY